ARNVGAKFCKLRLRQRVRPGDELARHCAPGTALSDAMLHARHLPRVPARQKVRENATVTAQLPIIIGRALPDAESGKVPRPERPGLPLVHRIIGDAVDADPAAAPGLRARPFDALIEILRFARRPHIESAW